MQSKDQTARTGWMERTKPLPNYLQPLTTPRWEISLRAPRTQSGQYRL